jgi:flavin-dependent dehydrogenase
MERYDAVIVGAGPAGGQCARALAEQGRRVLLVERHASFADNDFSSAGSLRSVLDEFQLPRSVVASDWREIEIQSTGARGLWRSAEPAGVVLDFAGLKGFLADETRRAGGSVRMGCEYVSRRTGDRDGHEILLKDRASGVESTVAARVVVDASGPNRAVAAPPEALRRSYRAARGLEFLIEVPDERYVPERLVFFLGEAWTPRGYAWIFPMGGRRLKVGAGQYLGTGRRERPLQHYIDRVVREWLHAPTHTVLDVHGATLKFSLGRKDVFSAPGLVAIGDAVSAVNALGGEGIRHGLYSAVVAARGVGQWLDGRASALDGYERHMRRYFDWRWLLSDRLSTHVYGRMSDAQIDRGVRGLGRRAGFEDVVDILFHYRFGKVALWAAQSGLRRLVGRRRAP